MDPSEAARIAELEARLERLLQRIEDLEARATRQEQELRAARSV